MNHTTKTWLQKGVDESKLPKIRYFTVLIVFLLVSTFTSAQTLYDVVLGTNNLEITEVQFEFNGSTITQTSGGLDPTPAANQTTLPVLMNYVKIDVGGTIKTLDFLNAKGALLASNNFTNATTGVGVYTEGTETLISNGVAGWEDAMQDMVSNRNALSYMFYDGSSNTPAGDDFDIYWAKALTNDDYLVVSERDGNTNFQLIPLDVNGNPIASARELRFGKIEGTNSPNGNKRYDWNIGYGSAGRNATQPQYFSVVDVNLFNTSQPIYGFRIDNLGDADVKFYGISDDTFEDNPTNPLVPGIEGNVFNDLDLLNDNTVDGSGISTPGGTQLYVSLIDSSNMIVDTMPVNNDGSYSFLDDVEANSNYTIVLHTTPAGSKTPDLPTDWINTGENQGTTAGNDGSVNGIIAVSVGTTTETELNFGIVEQAPATGSIGDTVWYDADANGSQNGGESGLKGATITLDPGTPGNTADDVTTTTDASGKYLFDNLPAGNYTVSVDVSTVTGGLPALVTPAELAQTYDKDGLGTANKSSLTLAAGEDNLAQDFGYQGLGSIGDTVWYDADANGSQNGGESGLKGATVTLDPGTPGNTADDVTTTTNASGKYLFDDLPAGNYTVSVDVSTVTAGLPSGVTTTELAQTYDNDGLGTANKSSLTLAAGEDNLAQDFGYRGLGSIGDTVWYDTDGNGAQNGSEGGLQGATVTLDPGTPGNTADDVTTSTNASGKYLFDDLPSGNYTVSVDVSTVTGGLPSGVTAAELAQTYDKDGLGTANKSSLTLADGEDNLAQDFGYQGVGTIGDRVWYDTNGDGGKTGENGLQGATVTLDPGTPGNPADDLTDITDANGWYLFEDLPAGNYTVTVDTSTITGGLPSGVTVGDLAQTFDDDGLGTPNTSSVSLAQGQDILDQDFGYRAVGSIGDTVWYDADGNGAQNGSESGLEGATVTLDPGTPGNTADDVTTTTDANGNYLFDDLPAGNYTVSVDVSTVTGGLPTGVTPAELSQTYDDDGTGTANKSSLTLAAGEDNLDQDFGYQGVGSIGDTVWYDTDGNGTQNGTEGGLEGATVTLDPGTPGNTADDTTVLTDANGNYLFDNLPAGNYTVTVDVSTITGGLPAGVSIADLRQTYDADGTSSANTSDYSLAAGEDNLDQDFGYIGLGVIGDRVWYDADGDGIQEAGEPGLEGATVTLVSNAPNFAPSITTTTDANGNYLFTGLPMGSYTVVVDVSTVTGGIPVGKTPADLVQTFDWDSVGTPNNSTINLGQSEINLIQDFGYMVGSGSTGGGNNGGIESESLGDALTKLYVGRKKNSVPTNFVKSTENLYNKSKMKSVQPYQGKGQTLLDMFPSELVAGNVANVTSPTDILDITIADEVLSVDFSVDGQTKAVVLGIKTTDKVYNHTKASCDRLRGAEILNVQKVKVGAYNFLMQGIKQRNGIVEYAISFATAKNNNDNNYSIQTNWYVNNYTKYNDMYNFQVWSTNPADTQKLVADILQNLNAFIPVQQTEVQKFPETYASKIYRDKGELVVALRSTQEGNTAEVSMVELYSETANNIKFRDNALTTEIQQALRIDIADGYEYDALVKVDDEVQDAFYHADGNWGLDYDKRYTEIKNYFVWNDFDREYQDDEYTINRSPEIKATSDYDYLTLYKALLPGTISADYSEYKYLSFTAKGSGLMELGLIKSSIEDWKAQYKVMVDFSEDEQTYYVPFEIFSSSATQEKLTADDLTMLTFTFLPVEANTTELDLIISDVKFTKTAVEEQIVNKIETFENEFMAYPNPSQGNVNLLLFSETDTQATITLTDITGKVIYNQKTQLNAGKNELDFNLKVKPGIMLLKVASAETDYGTSKILFR